MSGTGSLWIVGLGPGRADLLTAQAREALRRADVVVGYEGYFAWADGLADDKERIALPLGQEVERARLAVGRAAEGQAVCVISSGDPGIYGMAGVVLEALAGLEPGRVPEVAVVPGVSAVNAAAALLGAPLGHDFAVVSLSDLLTPWEIIEKRLRAAAVADFVLALLNPQSRRRDWQFPRAVAILREARPADTPVGIVRNAYRPEQSVETTTLARLAEARVDMFTTVIVGSSATRPCHGLLVTPRGYPPGEGRTP